MSKTKEMILGLIETNSCVYVDGKPLQGDVEIIARDKSGEEVVVDKTSFKIIVTGNVKNIETVSGDVVVQGDAEYIDTTSGDISVSGKCHGKVFSTSGNITVGYAGHVTALRGKIK